MIAVLELKLTVKKITNAPNKFKTLKECVYYTDS